MTETILVLGSGPIRIGQGIEFDYSCVHCVWALRELGYRAILINNNPETVSTDFDTGDGLYFEPVTADDVLAVLRRESAIGVVCQFGGQTAINLAEPLSLKGANVLGTSPEAIALAEDRKQFDALLESLGIMRPKGRAVRRLEEAMEVAAEVGYPVLVRPSFVLGGRAMEIVYSPDELREFYQIAEDANPGQPVLVDQYILGKEAEVDVISDGQDTLVPGIMEHIERAGVHSGDSMAVYPPANLSRETEWEMVDIACKLAKAIGVRGLMNIQFVIDQDQVYVIEVNPRASRTVPYLSKVTGVPMVKLATETMMGKKLADLGYGSGLWCSGEVVDKQRYLTTDIQQSHLFAVKAPVFSFQKLRKVEPSLGPEMKSTGEVMGIDTTLEAAIYKALLASGIAFKSSGKVALTVNERDKPFAVPIAQQLVEAGYSLVTTQGTHGYLERHGIPSELIGKIQDGSPNLVDLVVRGDISLMINTPGAGSGTSDEARLIRRICIETGIACITNIDTAAALARAVPLFADPSQANCLPYTDYRKRPI